MYLSNFRAIRPPHLVPQAEGLRWLARAQARAHPGAVDEDQAYRRIGRFGCGPDTIRTRGTYLADFTHADEDRMAIFGAGRGDLDARTAFFREVIRAPVERITPADGDFDAWIHVTCTGYASPSVVQEITSAREWGESVETLHAYHMGCYAAVPALRMARGLGRVEVTHTELCTLHLDPRSIEPEQLVVQSLFADGVIAYRVTPEPPTDRAFRVEATREVIAPDSRGAMTWTPGAAGFRMTLSREVPRLVRDAVGAVVGAWRTPGAVFAIHPGGPRIIDAVKDALGLSEEQVLASRAVLRDHGNMSSATLPHVWASLLADLPAGTPVISLAFGPGLTVAAALLRAVHA